jgi:hypothetical protein
LQVRPGPTRVKHLSGSPLYGNLWLFPQTLERAGKACRDKHSSLLQKYAHYGRKKLNGIRPWQIGRKNLNVKGEIRFKNFWELIRNYFGWYSCWPFHTNFCENLQIQKFIWRHWNCLSDFRSLLFSNLPLKPCNDEFRHFPSRAFAKRISSSQFEMRFFGANKNLNLTLKFTSYVPFLKLKRTLFEIA